MSIRLQGVTVLELSLDFTAEEFHRHYLERNQEHPTYPTLAATVKRKWYDDKTNMTYPVNTVVNGQLIFYVRGCRDEDVHGERFILNAVAAEKLDMEVGPIVKASANGDEPMFSRDTAGIRHLTPMTIFVDLAAARGAIISYSNPDSVPVDLALPDDLPFDPDPIIIPDWQRQRIDEMSLFNNQPAAPQNEQGS